MWYTSWPTWWLTKPTIADKLFSQPENYVIDFHRILPLVSGNGRNDTEKLRHNERAAAHDTL